jgi:hypothetical protein
MTVKSLIPPTPLKAKLFNQLTAAYKGGCIHLYESRSGGHPFA